MIAFGNTRRSLIALGTGLMLSGRQLEDCSGGEGR